MIINKVFLFGLGIFLLLLPFVFAGNGTGGDFSVVGSYNVHTFYSSGSFNWSGDAINVTLMVVAGGGAGGSFYGGGGGAGGLLVNTTFLITSDFIHNVSVGAGGYGHYLNGGGYNGYNGTNSSFDSVVSRGGGGGAGTSDASGFADAGGSGGGGFYTLAGGKGVVGMGNDGGVGGASASPYSAGGGGGSGGVGGNGVNPLAGRGGAGYNLTINGTLVGCFAGGGSGGGNAALTANNASCGGGNGTGVAINNTNYAVNGTGGGGGGGGILSRGGSGGSGIVIIAYPSGTSYTTASFISPSPSNNSHNNTMVNISLSCTESGANFYLWFDNVSGVTPVLVNSSVSFWVTNVSFNGKYFYKGACYKAGFDMLNTSVYSWWFDTSPPVISLNFDNEFNSLNYSRLNQFDDWLNLSILFTDNIGVYGIEFNITDASGSGVYNFSNLSIGNVTSFNFSGSVNVTSWAGGLYNVLIKASDTHTAGVIGDYVVSKGGNELVFDTIEGSKISITAVDSVGAGAVKSGDRYSFVFDYGDKFVGDTKTFYVKSLVKGDRVTYLSSSPFKAHFVIFNTASFSGNWVDFEGVDGKPVVSRVSDSEYSVSFSGLKDDFVIFNSVGGLNVVNVSYSWFRGKAYSTSGSGNFSGEPVSFFLNVTNHSSFRVVNVSLYNNGDYLSPIVNVNGSTNNYSFVGNTPLLNGSFVYNWSFFIVQGDGNVSRVNLSGSYNSVFWNLSDCSFGNASTGFNLTALRFSFFDENFVPNIFNGSLDLDIQLWINNKSNFKQLNFNLSDNVSYIICLNNLSSFRVDLYAKNGVIPSTFIHRYYLFNRSINGSQALNISLYNFNDTIYTDLLRITARDVGSANYYSNVIGVLERWYVGSGIWRVVQMDRSDDYGLLIYDVVEKTTDYRLRFYDTGNNLLRTSDILRFSCDNGVCELVAYISPSGSVSSSSNLLVFPVFDNSTGLLSVVWSDSMGLVSSVRMVVSKETITGSLLLFNVTMNGSSGSYDFNLSGVTGNVLLMVFKTSSPESFGGFSEWFSIVGSKFGDVFTGANSGEGAVWALLVIVVCACLGFFSIVAGIMGVIVGLIAMYSLGITSVISFGGLIGLVVVAIALGVKIRR